MTLQATRYLNTPIGELSIAASVAGVTTVSLEKGSPERGALDAPAQAVAWAEMARRELEAYFAGTLQVFEVPIVITGTPFQRAVWEELRRIPFGQTVTYRDVAERVAQRGAARAVGGACGRNPLLLIVPCHRVVGQSGLGGFTGGLGVKEYLLEFEGAATQASLG